jgi:hypothetical protein
VEIPCGSGKRTNRPTRRNASRGTPPDAEPLVSRGTPADEAQLGASGRSRQLGAALLHQANEECAGPAHSASVTARDRSVVAPLDNRAEAAAARNEFFMRLGHTRENKRLCFGTFIGLPRRHVALKLSVQRPFGNAGVALSSPASRRVQV